MATRGLSITGLITLLGLCLSLLGCPAGITVELHNEFDTHISVLSAYSNVVLARIEPGGVEDVVYSPDCFRIQVGETVYNFRPVRPSSEYLDEGVIGTKLRAKYTTDQRLVLYHNEDINDGESLELGRGCEGTDGIIIHHSLLVNPL